MSGLHLKTFARPSQGESQARSPAAVKAWLSSTTRVQVFSISAFPQGSLWRERPPRGECLPCATVCAGKRSPVPHQRSKRGGRSLHHPPLSCGAPTRRARRGCPPPPPHNALPRRTRGIRANPPPVRLSRQGPDHSKEGRPLREKRCGCQKLAPPGEPPGCATPPL